jgi:hypothetical protein
MTKGLFMILSVSALESFRLIKVILYGFLWNILGTIEFVS